MSPSLVRAPLAFALLAATPTFAAAAGPGGPAGGGSGGQAPVMSGPSAEALTDETRRKVTDEIKRFLEERCAQQCEVGQVNVTVARRKPPVGSTPGFEELQPDVKDYVVERADVDLMLDRKLPAAFRSGVRSVLQKKLASMGIPNAFHESILMMPTAQELDKLNPQAQPQYPAQQPQPQPKLETEKEP